MTGFRHKGSYGFLKTARPQALSAHHLRRDPGILQKDKSLQHSLIKLSGLSFCTANLADTTPLRASWRERKIQNELTGKEREGGRHRERRRRREKGADSGREGAEKSQGSISDAPSPPAKGSRGVVPRHHMCSSNPSIPAGAQERSRVHTVPANASSVSTCPHQAVLCRQPAHPQSPGRWGKTRVTQRVLGAQRATQTPHGAAVELGLRAGGGHWREEGSEGAQPQPDPHGLESVTLKGTMATEPCRGEAASGLGLGRDAPEKSSCTEDLPVRKWARGARHAASRKLRKACFQRECGSEPGLREAHPGPELGEPVAQAELPLPRTGAQALPPRLLCDPR